MRFQAERGGESALVAPVIEKKALAGQIFDLLENRIISGQLNPGSSLVEEDMAAEFGFSRSPVREALARLERTMLVERVGPRLRRVVVPTSKFISDIYDTWAVIEVGRCYSSCVNSPASDHRRIDKLLRGMTQSLKQRDISRHVELSGVFHDLLVSRCNNKYLADLHQDCQRYVQWFSNIYFGKVDISASSLREHNEIARHYVDKDFLGLTDSVRRHIRRQKNEVLAILMRSDTDAVSRSTSSTA